MFSAWIAYNVPAAMSFYWIISALISLAQSVVLGKLYSPAHITANSEARHAALLFENEARVPYAPMQRKAPQTDATKKKKKK